MQDIYAQCCQTYARRLLKKSSPNVFRYLSHLYPVLLASYISPLKVFLKYAHRQPFFSHTSRLIHQEKSNAYTGIASSYFTRTFLQKLISSLESSCPKAQSVQTYNPTQAATFLFQISTATQRPDEFPILLS